MTNGKDFSLLTLLEMGVMAKNVC